MKFEVEVISRETIKPSSPTPHHLRHYQFSFLDQINPPVFMPLLFFYPHDMINSKLDIVDKSNHLKNSLSETLTRFYPLAGRVVDNFYVDCNDEGVPYFETQVNCQLSDFIWDPIPNELNKLLPCDLDDVRDLPLVIQVNFFDCGGMAVSIGISHKIADALSFVMFVNSWAVMARGDETKMPRPRFESAELFPPRDTAGFKPNTGIVKDKIVTKRFIFTSSKVSALRDILANITTAAEYSRKPTRIEALSAFLWTRFMASVDPNPDPKKIYTVLHAVNLRTRIDPPLPEHYFGNISRLAIAVPCVSNETEISFDEIVNKVRDAIKKVNGDYVSNLKEGDKHLNSLKERGEKVSRGDVVSFSFTSLCRFPLYEADFGWGKPVWVGSASLTYKNLIVFMDSRGGDGIEAWVNLKPEDMAKFEVDKELLAFVSPSADAKNNWLL